MIGLIGVTISLFREELRMDEFDVQILTLLQENSRFTAERISDEVGLSAAAVQKRIKRLRDSGVIEREIAVVNPKSAGRSMTILVEVSMARENRAVLDNFKKRMRTEPLVQQCYYTTGESDFMLIMTVKDIEEYEQFTQDAFFGTPEVNKFKTTIVMDRVKVGLGVPIGS